MNPAQCLVPGRTTTTVSPLSLFDKLYIWSVLFEPLLFFVVFVTDLGISGNLSRLAQFVVVCGVALRFCAVFVSPSGTGIRLPSPLGPLYVRYALYFFLTLGAGVLVLLSGSYSLVTTSEESRSGTLGFESPPSSASLRVALEYGIALYYFAYFSVLPQYVLVSRKHISYFFRMFKKVFVFSLVIGLINVGLFVFLGIMAIPRQLIDWLSTTAGYAAGRFAGLAGEPRDAFVYLFLALAIFHLEAHFRGVRFKRSWVVLIIALALLTQSLSGLIGIACFIGLYAFYSVGSAMVSGGLIRAVRLCVQLVLLTTVTVGILYVGIIGSDRLMIFFNAVTPLWVAMESGLSGEDLPPIFQPHMNTIYPLYNLYYKLRNFDFLPVMIGSGLGSASTINSAYGLVGQTINPTSQLVRTLFESGAIGTGLFIVAFTSPVKMVTKRLPKRKQRQFALFALLVLGCVLGHRSAAIFIYLGLCIAVFRVMSGGSVQSMND